MGGELHHASYTHGSLPSDLPVTSWEYPVTVIERDARYKYGIIKCTYEEVEGVMDHLFGLRLVEVLGMRRLTQEQALV